MLSHPANSNTQLKLGIVFLGLLILGLILWLLNQDAPYQNPSNNQAPAQQTNTNSESEFAPKGTIDKLPSELFLKVPFTPQAPTANWDELHNEACEEASAIMVNAYFHDITSLPPITVEKQITALTEWQQENFGYHLSINTLETAEMIEANFPLFAEVVKLNEAVIKQALVDDKLVIIPANGQMLDNPNFKSPGPIYHMLVITGYDGDTMITNDPGTRKGEGYEYDYSILESATGNWNHNTSEVNLSDKQIIIVSK